MDIFLTYILPAIGIIAVIIAIFLVIKFVIFIFTSYPISRIISVSMGILGLVMGIIICATLDPEFDTMLNDKNGMFGLVAGIALVLQWLFFMGPAVFDKEWDGTWNISEGVGGTYHASPNITGGLLGNTIGSVIGVGICYGVIGNLAFAPMFIIMPSLLLIITIIGFLRVIFS